MNARMPQNVVEGALREDALRYAKLVVCNAKHELEKISPDMRLLYAEIAIKVLYDNFNRCQQPDGAPAKRPMLEKHVLFKYFTSLIGGRGVLVNAIINESGVHFLVDKEKMMSKSRKKQYVNARQVATFLIRRLMPFLSAPHIGRIMNCDHSTVLHSVKKVGESKELLASAMDIMKRIIVTHNVPNDIAEQVFWHLEQ